MPTTSIIDYTLCKGCTMGTLGFCWLWNAAHWVQVLLLLGKLEDFEEKAHVEDDVV